MLGADEPWQPLAHTYTSHMDLVDELQVQNDMLQRLSAQQRFILAELSKMRSGSGTPLTLPATAPSPFRAATCAW